MTSVFCQAHSNCRAAILLGKPVTIALIIHGRLSSLEVRYAPPCARPLCCLRRRGGLGVEPTLTTIRTTISYIETLRTRLLSNSIKGSGMSLSRKNQTKRMCLCHRHIHRTPMKCYHMDGTKACRSSSPTVSQRMTRIWFCDCLAVARYYPLMLCHSSHNHRLPPSSSQALRNPHPRPSATRSPAAKP